MVDSKHTADFPEKLSALVAHEMSDAADDAERQAVVLERLLHATSFTISLMSRGDAKATDALLMGAEAYLMERSVEFSSFGKLMTEERRDDEK